MSSFAPLYDYATKNGIVIPATSDIRTKVENEFKTIFGADIDTTTETPIGRLIEAITFLFVDICGVNAQNANGINPNSATGAYLDNIAALFGVTRESGESDMKFRNRILKSQSRGIGYVRSIWNELSKVSTLTSICVLENGDADPCVINGLTIDPHSIFACVSGNGTNEESALVAAALYATKAAGCAYHDADDCGTKVERTIDGTTVRFYRPTQKYVRFSVNVIGSSYTGEDIVGDTKTAILNYVKEHNTNSIIAASGVLAAVSLAGLGIVATSVAMECSDDGKVWVPVNTLQLRPFEVIAPTASNVEVIVG